MSTTEKENQQINQEALRIADLKQRIKEDEKQVSKLLIGLEGGLKVKPLTQTHKSVDISFAQMLAHIDEIIESIMLEENTVGSSQKEEMEKFIKKQITYRILGNIKKLLQTYRDMAERFYTQYKLSLLTLVSANLMT